MGPSADRPGDRSFPEQEYPFQELTRRVIEGFYEVHRTLGFGYLESAYRRALAVELHFRGIPIAQEVPFQLLHRGDPRRLLSGRPRRRFIGGRRNQDRVVAGSRRPNAGPELPEDFRIAGWARPSFRPSTRDQASRSLDWAIPISSIGMGGPGVPRADADDAEPRQTSAVNNNSFVCGSSGFQVGSEGRRLFAKGGLSASDGWNASERMKWKRR
jgi:hypothetical protein